MRLKISGTYPVAYNRHDPVSQSVALSDFHCVGVSGLSVDVWPSRHLIRMIRHDNQTKKDTYLPTYLPIFANLIFANCVIPKCIFRSVSSKLCKFISISSSCTFYLFGISDFCFAGQEISVFYAFPSHCYHFYLLNGIVLLQWAAFVRWSGEGKRLILYFFHLTFYLYFSIWLDCISPSDISFVFLFSNVQA